MRSVLSDFTLQVYSRSILPRSTKDVLVKHDLDVLLLHTELP